MAVAADIASSCKLPSRAGRSICYSTQHRIRAQVEHADIAEPALQAFSDSSNEKLVK
jgi:hypothetical protein